MSERKTSEWPALHEVLKRKMQIIIDREVEHAQHVVDHGAPRTRPEVWLAALVLMKANRVWNNMLRGGTADALVDSALDLGNYSDFLAALLLEMQQEYPKGHLAPVKGDFQKIYEAEVVYAQADHCFTCGEKFQPGSVAFGDVREGPNGRYYCAPHAPVEHE